MVGLKLCVCRVLAAELAWSCSEEVRPESYDVPPSADVGAQGDYGRDIYDVIEAVGEPDVGSPDIVMVFDDNEDGVPNDADNCPISPNEDQADRDSDGVGDVCDSYPNDPDNDIDGDSFPADTDNCPEHGNSDQVDSDEDGIGDVCDPCPADPGDDPDSDDVCTSEDNCPAVYNPDQADSDEDGVGDACGPCDVGDDDDNDGVCNGYDNCPANDNSDQTDRDRDLIGDACDDCPDDPDNDIDRDGWCANEDNCPTDSNPEQIDLDLDDIGDVCDPTLGICTVGCGDTLCDEGEDEYTCPEDCWEPDRPHVVSTFPLEGAFEVPEDTIVTVTFDRPMNPDTIEVEVGFIAVGGNPTDVHPGAITYNEDTYTATATFDEPLWMPGFRHEASVIGADTDGVLMSEHYRWRFLGDTTDNFHAIAVDNWGRTYISGYQYHHFMEFNHIPLLQYDMAGNLTLAEIYDSPHTASEADVWLGADNAGNIYLARENPGGLTVRKLDSAGRELWVTEVSGSSSDIFNAYGFAVSSNGNTYLSGLNNPVIGVPAWRDGFVVSLDTEGNWRWYRQFHKVTHETYSLDTSHIAVDANDNAYVVVSAFGEPMIDVTGAVCDAHCIVRYDSEGNGPWIRELPTDLFPWGTAYWDDMGIAVTPAGDVFLVGREDHTAASEIFIARVPVSVESPSGMGEVLWYESFGTSTDNDRWLGIAVDSADNVYVAGDTCGTFENEDGYENAGNSYHCRDIYVASYDASGNQRWIEQYGRPNISEESINVAVDPFGNVLVLGYAETVTGHEWFIADTDYVVARFDSNGEPNNTNTAGNNAIDSTEVCDDGNTASGDGCSADGHSDESCGNWIVDIREDCDDGNVEPGDGCSSDCLLEATCGNGLLDPGETCDDCNNTDADGCSAFCQDESCGNGIVDPGEGCDDNNTEDGDGCSSLCEIADTTNLGAIIDLALGNNHTCALLSDHTLRCWGFNADGQLGNGNNLSSYLPATVLSVEETPLADVREVDAAGDHTCALLSDGSVSCWGANNFGQLGNPDVAATTNVPTPVVGLDAPVRDIGLGMYHSCAVLIDGRVFCWGSDLYGQIGDGTSTRTDNSTPTQVTGLSDALTVTGGQDHTCALLTDGTVHCWGSNESFMLANGNDTHSPSPVQVELHTGGFLENAVDVQAGRTHTCALIADGTVSCWGWNHFGQVGTLFGTGRVDYLGWSIGTTSNRSRATSVIIEYVGGWEDPDIPFDQVAAISVGEWNSCAVRSDGTFNCWGVKGCQNDSYGRAAPVAMRTDGSTVTMDVVSVANGTVGETCDDGNETDDGNGCSAECASQFAWRCSGSPSVCWSECGDELTAVGAEACDDGNHVDTDGCSADCLSNESCGNGITDTSVDEVCDDGNTSDDDGCSADCLSDETCGNDITDTPAGEVCDDGNQLDTDGCSADCLSDETCGNGVIDASVGETCDDENETNGDGCDSECHLEDTCGNGVIDTVMETCDDGNNDARDGCAPHCQVEEGWTCDESTPSSCSATECGDGILAAGAESCDDGNRLSGDFCSQTCQLESAIHPISAGTHHTCALTDMGQVRCWGNNELGQLGDGTTDNSTTPVVVNEVPGAPFELAISISANGAMDWDYLTTGHTCALLLFGAVACWGDNQYGQLGNGEAGYGLMNPQPTYLPTIDDAISISAGTQHVCAVHRSGAVSCWGFNYHGQLGDGSTVDSPTPVTVDGIDNAIAVSAGYSHTCAILDTGRLMCWGANESYQLGDGTLDWSPTPVEVTTSDGSALQGVVAVETSSLFFDTDWAVGHTCALLSDHSLVCWGYNEYGQVGNGDDDWLDVPTPTTVLEDVASIGLGLYHSCAVLTDGSTWCWGDNSYGQLGDITDEGAFGPSNVPIPVVDVGGTGNLTGMGFVVGGGHMRDGWPSGHTCALRNDNSAIVCWGGNNDGQLGNTWDIDELYCDWLTCVSPYPVLVGSYP